MQLLQKAGEKVKAILEQKIADVLRSVEYLRDRLTQFFGLHHVDEALIYTEQENKLIDQTIETLVAYFPDNPGKMLLDEDYESRCEAIEDLASELAALYQVEGLEILITDSDEVFSEGNGVIYGFACIGEGTVYINRKYLYVNDAAVLEHIVSTVIHELRHMMQGQVMTLRNTYGVPYNRRSAWRDNAQNYVAACEDLEGYYNQPLEYDARNFANRVWRGAYHKTI